MWLIIPIITGLIINESMPILTDQVYNKYTRKYDIIPIPNYYDFSYKITNSTIVLQYSLFFSLIGTSFFSSGSLSSALDDYYLIIGILLSPLLKFLFYAGLSLLTISFAFSERIKNLKENGSKQSTKAEEKNQSIQLEEKASSATGYYRASSKG